MLVSEVTALMGKEFHSLIVFGKKLYIAIAVGTGTGMNI